MNMRHCLAKRQLALSLLLLAPVLTVSILRAEDGGGASYPRTDLLMEPSQLVKADVAKGLLILDARGRAKYDQGHVPGARWVDHAGWAKAFADGKDADGWSKRIGG